MLAFCFMASLALLTSCQGNGKHARETTQVFVLFDVSGSTSDPAIRRMYFQDFSTILRELDGGDTIIGDVITDNTLATSTYPIHATLPQYDILRYSQLTYQQALKTTEQQVRALAEQLVLHSTPAPRTDLMNAFELAAKIFNGDEQPGCRKVLVVFSDMVEQSGHYDFTAENMSDEHIQQIIAAERASGRLPDLHGVNVWIAGATAEPSGGLDPLKIYQIQRFWLRYFQACGADLSANRYATRLINFRLH